MPAAPSGSCPAGALWCTKQNKWRFKLTEESRDGFNVLMFWTERPFKLRQACHWQGRLEQLRQWKEASSWRLIIAGNKSSVFGFCTFLFVQRCSFCTVYNKWRSPSMGYHGKKQWTSGTHFWQSDYSVWAVRIQISALFYQIATTVFLICLCLPTRYFVQHSYKAGLNCNPQLKHARYARNSPRTWS